MRLTVHETRRWRALWLVAALFCAKATAALAWFWLSLDSDSPQLLFVRGLGTVAAVAFAFFAMKWFAYHVTLSRAVAVWHSRRRARTEEQVFEILRRNKEPQFAALIEFLLKKSKGVDEPFRPDLLWHYHAEKELSPAASDLERIAALRGHVMALNRLIVEGWVHPDWLGDDEKLLTFGTPLRELLEGPPVPPVPEDWVIYPEIDARHPLYAMSS